MKVVAALAIMKDGKMLMGKRKDNGKWTNPGGHVDEGEAPIDGAIREAKEEAGLDLTHDRLSHLETRIVETPGGKITVHGYKVNLDEGATTIKNDPDDEVHRWHWVSLKPPLNKDIFNNLHVPIEDNVLLGSMEIKVEKKAFFVGFEKRAFVAVSIPVGGRAHHNFRIKDQKAKDEYVKDKTKIGRNSGAGAGGLIGGTGGMVTGLGTAPLTGRGSSGKAIALRTALGALGGGALGALTGGALGHRSGKKMGQRHADAGVGSTSGYSTADAYSKSKKYRD